jgi:hypothetical protein
VVSCAITLAEASRIRNSTGQTTSLLNARIMGNSPLITLCEAQAKTLHPGKNVWEPSCTTQEPDPQELEGPADKADPTSGSAGIS